MPLPGPKALTRRRAVQAVLEVRRVSKAFDRRNAILKGVSFSLLRGEMVALIGASGAQVDPDPRHCRAGPHRQGRRRRQHWHGQCRRGQFRRQRARRDHPVRTAHAARRPHQRRGKQLRVRVGVIFQQFNLVPRLSVLTNVCLRLLEARAVLPRHDRPLQ
jgi:phosphonate transport system ATP-binding protein